MQKTSYSGKMVKIDLDGNEMKKDAFTKEELQEMMIPEVLGYNVLIRPDDNETKSRGGILLPETTKRKAISGVVVGVGPGKFTETGAFLEITRICVGDKVAFRRNIPIEEIDIEGVTHYLINADGVILNYSSEKKNS